MHKNNLELASEIVMTMIDSGRIEHDKNSNYTTSQSVCNALEKVFAKLNELENQSCNNSEDDAVAQVI